VPIQKSGTKSRVPGVFKRQSVTFPSKVKNLKRIIAELFNSEIIRSTARSERSPRIDSRESGGFGFMGCVDVG